MTKRKTGSGSRGPTGKPNRVQIQTGEIGNPHGRRGKPKAGPELPIPHDHMFMRRINRKLNVRGEIITVQERLAERRIVTALQGNEKVSAGLQEKKRMIERENQQRAERNMSLILPLKTAVERKFDGCQSRGEAPPDIMPHPDHAIFCDGELVQRGPIDERGAVCGPF